VLVGYEERVGPRDSTSKCNTKLLEGSDRETVHPTLQSLRSFRSGDGRRWALPNIKWNHLA